MRRSSLPRLQWVALLVFQSAWLLYPTDVPSPAHAALPSIATRDAWTCVESRNFVCLTNAESGPVGGLLRELEALRAVLASGDLGLGRAVGVPLRIVVFDGDDSFLPYNRIRSDGTPATQAYFQPFPSADYLAIALPRGPDAIRVVYHEFLHAILYENAPRIPLWLNEGLAEFYSTFRVEAATAVVGEPIGLHLELLEDRLEEQEPIFDLRGLFAITGSSSEYTEHALQGLYYAESAVLTHMLAQSGIQRGTFRNYLNRLTAGEDPTVAFEAVYGAESYDTLLTGLARYVRSGGAGWRSYGTPQSLERYPVRATPAARPDILATLGDLARMFGDERSGFAREHYDAALAIQADHPAARIGLGLLTLEEDLDAAMSHFERALASNPGDEEAAFWVGRALVERELGDGAGAFSVSQTSSPGLRRAQDLLARSLDRVPARSAALGAYALSCRFEWGERIRPALVRFDRAAADRSAVDDVLVALVGLRAQAGDRSLAERLAQERIDRMRILDASARARQHLMRADLRQAYRTIQSGQKKAGADQVRKVVEATDDALVRRQAAILLAMAGEGEDPSKVLEIYDQGVAAMQREDWGTAQARFEEARDKATDPALRREAEARLTDVLFVTGLKKAQSFLEAGMKASARAQLDILGHLPLRDEQRKMLTELREKLSN